MRIPIVQIVLWIFLHLISIGYTAEPEAQPRPEWATRVAHLIKQLDADTFELREQAQTDLIAMGPPLLEHLRLRKVSDSPEIKIRLRTIVRQIHRAPLIGTNWRIECSGNVNLGPEVITFKIDGTFTTTSGSSATKGKEKWEILKNGRLLRMSFNGDYAIYEAVPPKNGSMKGIAKNIKGNTWTWTATKLKNKKGDETAPVKEPSGK